MIWRPRTVVVLLAVLGAALTLRLVSPLKSLHAATSTVSPAQSYLVILGATDTAATNWDGSITVNGAAIQILRGWRNTTADSITGTTSWKISTRTTPALTPPGPVQENGLIVKISEPATTATVNIQTTQGSFSFSTQNVPFGTTRSFLNGRVLVVRTGAQFQLTTDNEEEDFPAMARSGDDIYLTYTQFVHGDRSKAVSQSTTTEITDFSFLSRPAGGDQLLLMHYSVSTRTWTGPFPVTDPGQDLMRSAVAIDGQGRAWVVYSANRSNNFDLYARRVAADGTLSPELRITSDPGTDILPVAATDSYGRVWIAWQAFRNNNLEILAAAQTGDTFSPEAFVSTSPASDWEPAIAASSDGQVAIAWDTYDKGDYDVYLRRAHFTDQIGFDDPLAIAASNDFEARPSLAFDPQNRLWIAYEHAGSRWGKDFGAYDSAGLPLYSSHTIEVLCLIGNDLYSTTDSLYKVLPGATVAHLFQTPLGGALTNAQPDPTLAQKRSSNNNLGAPAGPKNSHPRIAVDSDGTVYLEFRELAGTGLSSSRSTGGVSIGSIWISQLVYFDGVTWHGPGVLEFSDSVGDNQPAMVPLSPGHMLIAHMTDHRLSPTAAGTPAADGCNADIFQSELVVSSTPQTPALQRIGTVIPSPPDSGAAAEAATAALARSYRPTVAGRSYQLVRGDFHRHTEVSWDGRGDGPLIDAYRYYIDAAALNWAGCCDHDNGESREYTWWIVQKFTDAFLLPGKFTPMFYYERSISYPEGHRNVAFAQRGIRPLPRLPLSAVSDTSPAPDTNMLYNYLKFYGGITAAHTSATDQGTDWRNNDPTAEPFVEIYQGDRQDYEMPGAPRSNTSGDSISGYESAGYVGNAFAKGYLLGFEASSDHVSTHISYTDIWVPSPTRANILDAMHKRRMYGSTDDIVADVRSGGHFMGEAFTTSSAPVFTVRLWGTAPFQNVTIIKDGNVAYSTSGDRALAFSWQDPAAKSGKTSYYYVRGLQTDGNIVWVSPMWVTMQ